MTIHIDKKVKRKLKKTYLWRYMSFAKFLDLITTSELYFASNKELIKGDPYEGTLPAFINAMFSIEKDSLSYKNLPDDARNYFEPFFINVENVVRIGRNHIEIALNGRKRTF